MIRLLQKIRRHDISFSRNGVIRISARLARSIALSPGDSVNIAIHDGEYLLYAIHNTIPDRCYTARCFQSKRGGGNNLCAQSVSLCRSLLDRIDPTASSLSFMAGETIIIDDTPYAPIITRNPS